MKKLFNYLIILLLSSCIYLYQENKSYCKVFKIISPTEIYVDLNKNLIFDEKSPIEIKDLYYICSQKKDDNFSLSKEESIFLNFQAVQVANNLLKNKYVKIKNNEIYINNRNYKDILLNSGFFYKNTDESKKIFLKNLKNFNIEEYVAYNIKSKKFHKLDCEEIKSSKNISIVKKEDLKSSATPCQKCNKTVTAKLKEEKIEQIKIEKTFQKENIKIIFTDLNETFLPNKQCTNEACKTLKNEIDNAKSSIDFAIYGISNQPEIINSLKNAQKRGVKIRWVCDFDKKDKDYYKDTKILKQIIKSYNTDITYDSNNRPAIMHNKFFIFDNQKVFTGSSNITSTDISGFNSNISILVNSKELANIYLKEFEQMYNGLFHTDKKQINKKTIQINEETKADILFSPKDKIITTKIIPLIENAKKYIYIPVFFITKKEILNALVYAHNKGVDIKIINDATNANTKYSVHKQLRDYGIQVKTENYAGKLHSKAIIIDDEISVIGSMNFSNNGEKRNDENVLVIYDKEITRYLKNTFLHLWNKIPSKYLNYDPKAESLESIGSCSDNIDNDFDEKIDKEDSSCLLR